MDKISFDDKKLIEPRASKEAIAFVKENIAENVNINGLDTKSLNALTHSLASQMKNIIWKNLITLLRLMMEF